MRYFKLNPNVISKKWKGIVNLGELLYKNKELNEVELAQKTEEILLSPLHYEVLVAGTIFPVNTIGSVYADACF